MIAYDAISSSGAQTTSTSYSWSHTCSGSNRVLAVSVSQRTTAGNTVTGITYNGVALTQGATINNGTRRADVWYLFAPATGSNTIAVTLSAAPTTSCAHAISLCGVDSSGTDATNTATGSSASPSVAVTTVANNAWVIDCLEAGNPIASCGADQSSRQATDQGGSFAGGQSTYGPKPTAGAVTMSWNLTVSATWAHVGVSFKPVSSGYSAYTYNRTITITSNTTLLPSTQTNFPVLVKLDSSNASTTMKTVGNGGRIQATGLQTSGTSTTIPLDLIFTSDSAGTTKIPWEVEYYDGTNGILYAWVKISSCATSTAFYVFYGNSSIDTSQNTTSFTPANVWDSNFRDVWHLTESASPFLDSVGITNNPLTASSVTFQAAGEIKYGFTSASSSVVSNTAAYNPVAADAVCSMSVWAYYTSAPSGTQTLISRGPGVSYCMMQFRGGTAWGVYSNGGGAVVTSSTIPSANAWHHYAMICDGTNTKIYVDGAQAATAAAKATAGATATLGVGYNNTTFTERFLGTLDEVRISTTNRSADWITADYNATLDPQTFASVGAEVGGSFIWNPLGGPLSWGYVL